MKKTLLLCGAVTALACTASAQSRSGGLPGVWKIAEVTTSTGTNTSPQPGLYIFTAKHYSALRVNGDKPRPAAPPDLAKATAAELLAIYGPSFTANSGTYEVSGDQLTMRPMVAKNPGLTGSTTALTSQFKLQGDTLWITTSGLGGQGKKKGKGGATTTKFTRVE